MEAAQKQRLHELVDRLPPAEVPAAARYLEFLVHDSEAPVEPDMLRRIDEARRQRAEGIPHDAVLREFGM